MARLPTVVARLLLGALPAGGTAADLALAKIEEAALARAKVGDESLLDHPVLTKKPPMEDAARRRRESRSSNASSPPVEPPAAGGPSSATGGSGAPPTPLPGATKGQGRGARYDA